MESWTRDQRFARVGDRVEHITRGRLGTVVAIIEGPTWRHTSGEARVRHDDPTLYDEWYGLADLYPARLA
jgi:hypothetical protein